MRSLLPKFLRNFDSCSMGLVTQIEDLDKSSQLVSGSNDGKSSYKEHRVDALAPYAEEGPGKLRKATGSRKQAPIRRYPNGGTRQI